MKRIALYLGIVAALTASCSIQEESFEAPQMDDVIFYASFEQPAEETRVYANEDLLLRWNADDRVSIFNKITYNQQYKFTGNTGANAGGFEKIDTDEFVTGNPISYVVSVYPYQEFTEISENEVLTLTLPAEQHYAENTFGLGANTMVSVSEDNVLQYKSVGGFLRLRLYGEGVSVSSITLKGNNGEKLAGKATVTMPLDGAPVAVLAEDASDMITLVCDPPVALGATAQESKDFWFVVPPVTFSKGFTVSVNQTTGGVFEKSTSKSITIGRNSLSKMSPMEVEGGAPTVSIPEAIDLGLPSGLKWASFNLGATSPEEFGDYFAWGETEPKSSYDWSTYKWCKGSTDTMTKYCTNSSYGYNGFTDNKTVLDPEDDAAHVYLGGDWRMPTDAEMTELRELCTWEWTSMNGINGWEVTGSNGNSIFLPAAGWRGGTGLYSVGSDGGYYSSSLDSEIPDQAWLVSFLSGVLRLNNVRYYGISIRPVYPGEVVPVESLSLNKTSLNMTQGNQETLIATIEPANAPRTVTWTSDNTSVATVSTDGTVTAVSAGTATITAMASDGVHFATCEVMVTFPVPEAIDLGLPSGLQWATFNLGASKPEEYGNYYSWGETEPKSYYYWSTYKWCNGSFVSQTKYNTNSSYGPIVDNKIVLDPEDDAVRANWGDSWHMPSYGEWEELLDNCTTEWTTQNGIDGRLLTSKINGKSIFLPATGYRNCDDLYAPGQDGYYWTSSLDPDIPSDAFYLYFTSETIELINYYGSHGRDDGRTIRPVYREFISVTSVSLDKNSLELRVGDSAQLNATISPSNATAPSVSWVSGDESIVSVDQAGNLTALAEGSTTITAYSSNGLSASCSVTVRELDPVPEAIDLGLPSGLKWASFNLGAFKPEEYGDYYAWGETEPYYSSLDPLTWADGKESGYAWKSYHWCKGSEKTMTKYCSDSSYGYNSFRDSKRVLDPEDDAAAVILGGKWRMPTDADWTELRTKCSWEWTSINGVNGRVVTGPNGNSIFLPAAGFMNGTNRNNLNNSGDYWSSSLNTPIPSRAWYVYYNSSNIETGRSLRHYGFTIRAVTE